MQYNESDDLQQELTADYRTLELAGDHYHLGYQMGLATPMRIVESWRNREEEIEAYPDQSMQATLWSMMADLTARQIFYCLGAPCRNEFRQWNWPA